MLGTLSSILSALYGLREATGSFGVTRIVAGLNHCSEAQIFLHRLSPLFPGDRTSVDMPKIFRISPGLLSQLVYDAVILSFLPQLLH